MGNFISMHFCYMKILVVHCTVHKRVKHVYKTIKKGISLN